MFQQLNGQLTAAFAAPALFAPPIAQLRVHGALIPILAQIAERQKESAQALTVPLMVNVRTQSKLAGLVVHPFARPDQ